MGFPEHLNKNKEFIYSLIKDNQPYKRQYCIMFGLNEVPSYYHIWTRDINETEKMYKELVEDGVTWFEKTGTSKSYNGDIL